MKTVQAQTLWRLNTQLGIKDVESEGIPILENKFKSNLNEIYDSQRSDEIYLKLTDYASLSKMSVPDFQELLFVKDNSFLVKPHKIPNI